MALFATYQQTVLLEGNRPYERFNELAQLATMLTDACNEGERLYPGFTHIIGDVWQTFYSLHPQLDISKKQSHEVQYHLLHQIMQTADYQRWQELTVGDELLSVLTTVAVADQLTNWLKNAEGKEAQKKLERAEHQQQRLQTQQQLLAKKITQAQQNSEKQRLQQQQKFIQKQLVHIEHEQREAKLALSAAMKNIPADQWHDMLVKSKRQAQQTKETVTAIGTLDGKKLEQVPVAEQFQLAEHIQTHAVVKNIAELTGRFRRIVKKKQKTTYKMTMARQNITLGQEVSRLLPIELANLIMPHAKVDFLRRYAEQQTLIFDAKGKERRGRGPIIICMDESSSMTSIKEESKAFCLALLMIASKQKRDFAIIPFSTDIGEVAIFPKGRSSAEAILHFSQQFLGGGTNYEKPLRASLDILSRSAFNEADLLFVTDGSSYLSSQFLDEFNTIKKKRRFECTSIILTNYINTVDITVVERFSDKVIEVHNLFEAEDVFAMN